MADVFSREKRSEVMSKIKGKNTKPELIVRKFLHSRGFRFRLHNKSLPGSPDIKLAKYNTVIFVHGCFWHSHADCRDGRTPKSNSYYWKQKLEKNILRDTESIARLKALGWSVIVIWACEVTSKNADSILNQLSKQIKSTKDK